MRMSLTKALIIYTIASTLLCSCKNDYHDDSISKQENVFEEFWGLFEDNYAFFELHNIDWQASYQQNRSLVSENTTDEALFDLFCEMIKPFNDDHVSLSADKLKRSCDAGKPSKAISRIQAAKIGRFKPNDLVAMIDKTLGSLGFDPLKNKGKALKELQGHTEFQYSDNGRYGYIRVGRCLSDINIFYYSGPVNEIDEILAEFGDIEGLILDARYNIGGLDPYCERIAGRFISKKKLAYYRQTRDGDYEDFTKAKPFYIKPMGKQAFLKPVVVLTNDQTVSAADLFALIMSEIPHVTLMGENSNGSFSTILENKLSNGWQLNLSNQRYTSVDGVNYEGIGVPVDIEAFNPPEDFIKTDDSVIRKAVQYLNNDILIKP